MKNNIFVTLFIVVCFVLFAVSINLYNCHRANVMLRKTVTAQANEILELCNNQHTDSTIMYVGLKK